MKVLVVANMFPSKKFPTYGTFIRNFCNQLDKIDIHHDKVVMYKQTNLIRKVLGYISFYFNSFFRTLLGNYDVIYIHYPSYSALAVLLANGFRKKSLYINVHGSDVFPTNKKQEKLEKNTRKAINQADKVIVPSEYFRRAVTEKYMYPREKIYVYPSGGVDFSVFHPFDNETIQSSRKKAGLDSNKITVGYISRLYRLKGWDTFVNAVEKLTDYYDKVQFIIVGSGPDEDDLVKMLEEKQLTNVVHRFPAQPQRELANYYNMLDVFVFAAAAAAESLGLVALEAMACGVPVFASDYAAPKYYVENGKNGYKFPLGDYEQLAVLIEKYINSSDQDRGLLKIGALSVAEQYNSEASEKILKGLMI
ncbi:MAG: glycosyltransferase family 4 protein [Lachnospiraceae bacterium]|nr:glycosyltransferase family 4 protein [Lachnospiraceae bacterium]MBR1851658.1 glycosyltransferase family 4 protein [Lachnospiraceae bacterium]